MLNHILQGKVIKGEAVGRIIGFPTANLKLTAISKIKPGVYAALVTLNSQSFLGLAYYGPRYIFGQKTNSFEVYIFNFNHQIYGQTLIVKLLKFLRPPQTVKQLPELKKLLESDLACLNNYVILVDKDDRILGIETKIKAHLGKAKLHRAISVQLFNANQELLIQQRSVHKILFPLHWANTVCTDVRPYETYLVAANRRLQEEFGLTADLKPLLKFSYSASYGKTGSEKEIDQVFIGFNDNQPKPDPAEIIAWQYLSLDQIKTFSGQLAPWFKILLKNLSVSDIFKS